MLVGKHFGGLVELSWPRAITLNSEWQEWVNYYFKQKCDWYLVPQTVIICLADPDLSIEVKEEVAKILYAIKREPVVEKGKPSFPYIQLDEGRNVISFVGLVSSKSWLLFDLIGLSNDQVCVIESIWFYYIKLQEWLQLTAEKWPLFSDFQKFIKIVRNVSIVNDEAESVNFK